LSSRSAAWAPLGWRLRQKLPQRDDEVLQAVGVVLRLQRQFGFWIGIALFGSL
jgi:hypothetical protein